jgi:hypothetical protein
MESADEKNRRLFWLTQASQTMDRKVPLSASSSPAEEQPSNPPACAFRPVTPQTEGRLQRSPPLSVETSKFSKRKADNTDNAGMESLNSDFRIKAARMQMNTTATTAVATAEEDPCVVWAKSLVNDLNMITNENRKLLQITINRLVQDEIEKQIETEISQMEQKHEHYEHVPHF